MRLFEPCRGRLVKKLSWGLRVKRHYLPSIALLFLSSCGVEVKGLRDVKVTHEVNVTAVIPYITAYCELGNSTPEDVQHCVNVEIGKLLSKI